ncbi:MAG: tetratricopeptide repeat protein, partial [Chloroflexota bacterium]
MFDLPGPTTTTHSRALSAAGCLAGLLGDYGLGARLLAGALTAATASGDAQALAQANLGLGAVAAARNAAKVARPHFAAAMEQFAAAGDLFQVAHVQCMLGLLALHCEHDHMATAADGDRSLATFRSLGNGLGVAIALELVGELHRMAGNSRNARQFGEECLELYRRVQDQPGVAAALHNLGNAAFDQEEWAQAHEYYTDSLQLHWRLGNQRMVGVLLDRCACLAAIQPRPEATMQLG